jgi:hypothetical protein
MSWRKRRWGPSQTYARGSFDERAFRRDNLPAWESRWQSLTVEARAGFLDDVKIPAENDFQSSRVPPSTEPGRFTPAVLKELTEAGFVDVRSVPGQGPAKGVFAAAGVHDFALRIRILKRHHLLGAAQEGAVKAYVASNYFPHDLTVIVMDVLRKVGICDYPRLNEALERYVLTHRWVDWVILALNDPLAPQIVDRIVRAGGTVSFAELDGEVAKASPSAVRAAVERLVSHLALFEDLDPVTHELRVGLYPLVLEPLIQARRPRQRPPLAACDNLKDSGPDEGFVIADLRAVLLELASAPARLRQDHSLFQKQVPRFENAIEPLPGWMSAALKVSATGRLDHSLQMAKSLQLVQEVREGDATYLHLTPSGQEWLIGSMDDQFLAMVAAFRTPLQATGPYMSGRESYMPGFDSHGYSSRSDARFLGANVVSVPVEKGAPPPGRWDMRQERFEPLRRALDGIFSALPGDVFYLMEGFVAHAVYGECNPLLLGRKPAMNRVAVYGNGYFIPPLADRLEETARSLLLEFLGSRLIPLGCVRLALHEQGLALARDPRLDAYFGRRIVRETQAGAAATETKVIVQPDYSVVIIGTSHAPAAELLPFCERSSSGSAAGRGALVLKITRESVLQAIATGLPPAEILVRLKRHATHELPANVEREVEGWTGWIRRVSVERLIVIRCPDREAADRVMGALPKQVERIQDTIVALSPAQLTPLECQKLLDLGIIVDGAPSSRASGPKPRAKPTSKTRQKPRSYQ